MTTLINPEATSGKPIRLGRNDFLLQELWAIKADLNASSEYCVEKLVEQANNFDLDAKLASLQQQIRGSHH
jgi:hypothetical protein